MSVLAASCVIEIDGASSPQVIAGALSPEAGSGVPGTEATVDVAGRIVRIALRAKDVSSLRAAVNSYLRWASLAQQAGSVSRKGE